MPKSKFKTQNSQALELKMPGAKRSAYSSSQIDAPSQSSVTARVSGVSDICTNLRNAVSASVLFSNRPGAKWSAYPPLFYFQTVGAIAPTPLHPLHPLPIRCQNPVNYS
ncbi:MAG: hypothetical protein F6J93_29970 [Oscillatoria sp. SIO1A7]|nr:hypothetical protein [Oscillatoria sp. SIO1A7]